MSASKWMDGERYAHRLIAATEGPSRFDRDIVLPKYTPPQQIAKVRTAKLGGTMSAVHGWSWRFRTMAPGFVAAIFAVGIALVVLSAETNAAAPSDARDKAVFTALIAPLIQAAEKENVEYTQRLAALNLDSIFSAESLASDPDMRRAKAKIAEARRLADFYHDRERRRREEITALIDVADVSEGFKSGARKASAAPDATRTEERMWSALSAYYDSLDRAADILIDMSGRWRVTSGALHLEMQTDIDRIELGFAGVGKAKAALNAAIVDMAAKRDDAFQYLEQPQP